ncbi:MAG: hypothetical protein U0Y96_12435 [Candidatus Kapaibacterium sp.]
MNIQTPVDTSYVPRIITITPDSVTINSPFSVLTVNVFGKKDSIKLLLDDNRICNILKMSTVDSTTTITASYDRQYCGKIKLVYKNDTIISIGYLKVVNIKQAEPSPRLVSISNDTIEVNQQFVIIGENIGNNINQLEFKLSNGIPLFTDSLSLKDSTTCVFLHSEISGYGYVYLKFRDTTLILDKVLTIKPEPPLLPKIIKLSSDTLRPKRFFYITAANIGVDSQQYQFKFTDGVQIFIDSVFYSDKVNVKSNRSLSKDVFVVVKAHFNELSKGDLVMRYKDELIYYNAKVFTTFLPWDLKYFYFEFVDIPCSQITTVSTKSLGNWYSTTTHDTIVQTFKNLIKDMYNADRYYYNYLLKNSNEGYDINFTDYPCPLDNTWNYLYVTINPDLRQIQHIKYRTTGNYDVHYKDSWTFDITENIPYTLSNDTLVTTVTGNQLARIIHGFNYNYNYSSSDRYERNVSKDNYLALKPTSKLIIKIWY